MLWFLQRNANRMHVLFYRYWRKHRLRGRPLGLLKTCVSWLKESTLSFSICACFDWLDLVSAHPLRSQNNNIISDLSRDLTDTKMKGKTLTKPWIFFCKLAIVSSVATNWACSFSFSFVKSLTLFTNDSTLISFSLQRSYYHNFASNKQVSQAF